MNNNIILKNENDSLNGQLYTNNENKLYKALLHDSDNGIAESLLLNDFKKFIFDEFSTEKAIRDFKNKWGDIFQDELIWYDGSGVSRYNMFTPRTINRY